MPELPEVETVVRLLRPRLVGRSIRAVEVRWPRTLGGLSVARFRERVLGARCERVWRRAKFLVFDLARGREPAGCLIGHLRMTGRMHVEPAGWDPGPYAKVRLELDDGASFHFIDVRKFGRLVWAARPEQLLGELGPEPLSPEFTAELFAQALRTRSRQLKPLLLDQQFVAGLGNIYVDESLHRAGLHPLLDSRRVRPEQAERLHAAIRATLAAAIEREGSSFDTFYRTPEGNPGSYQHEFQVYGRGGEPCRSCGARIERIVVGQRGTHFCPRCQARVQRGSARRGAR